MAGSTKHLTGESPKRRIGSRNWLKTIVSYLLVLLLLGFFLLVFGRVSGTEINADSLQRRDYTFFQIPVVQVQCSPVWRSSGNDRVANTLKSEGHLLPQSATNRWDVIAVNVGGRQLNGKAEILDEYLGMAEDTGQAEDWELWTIEHPQRATVLWNAVHRAVQLNAYELVPYLFNAAESTDDPQELRTKIGTIAAREYAEIAADHAAIGETLRARTLYEASLEYQASDEHRRAYNQLKREH